MERKHKLLIAALVVVCVVLAVIAVDRYTSRPRAPKTESLSQAFTAQKTLTSELQSVQASDASTINQLKASNASLTTQKTEVCSLLQLHRYYSLACN